jgi:signal transduction histidine kinase
MGMLSVSYSDTDFVPAGVADLTLAFANQAAIALENSRLFEDAEQRTKELEALYHADEELLRFLSLDDILQALIDIATIILHADKSSILVWEDNKEKLVVRASTGFSPETLNKMAFAPGEGTIGLVAATGRMVALEDVANVPEAARWFTQSEGIHSIMNAPLKVGGEIFGVFNVNYSTPRGFDEEHQRLFNALAQRAALAIENAQLYERSKELAVVEERSRLARDLHDAVTQTLFSASLIAEVLPRIWERDQAEGQRRLEELRELTRGALAEMRTLLLELRPSALLEAELPELLRQLAESITGRARVPIHLEVEGECPLPMEVKIALYRIAQEALNNIAKHAGASQVVVGLSHEPTAVKMSISDDGQGFDQDQVSPESLGLVIMRDRAKSIGARLEINSEIDGGTEISIEWLSQAAQGEDPAKES